MSKKTLVLINHSYLELEAGEPLQLLDYNYDSDNNMTVSLKAESVEKLFLNSIVANREVVIVSIAGAFRKGKSFMLNYMLRYLYANVRLSERSYGYYSQVVISV